MLQAWNGLQVAKIRKSFPNNGDIFVNKQTYGVEVAAGADHAMVSVVLLLFELFRYWLEVQANTPVYVGTTVST